MHLRRLNHAATKVYGGRYLRCCFALRTRYAGYSNGLRHEIDSDQSYKACAKDALLGDLMHPHRERYPEDFVEHFRRRLNRYLHDSTHYHVVTYETYEGEEVITGYADWLHRDGRSEEPHNVASNTGNYPRAGRRLADYHD